MPLTDIKVVIVAKVGGIMTAPLLETDSASGSGCGGPVIGRVRVKFILVISCGKMPTKLLERQQ